jgi:hypothetical protein
MKKYPLTRPQLVLLRKTSFDSPLPRGEGYGSEILCIAQKPVKLGEGIRRTADE